jgi:hypothetical protein
MPNINDFVTKTLRFRSCAREISPDRHGNASAGLIKRQEIAEIPVFTDEIIKNPPPA